MKILFVVLLLLSPNILYAAPKVVTGSKDIVIDNLIFGPTGEITVGYTVYLVDSDGKVFKYSDFKIYTSTLYIDIVLEALNIVKEKENLPVIAIEP